MRSVNRDQFVRAAQGESFRDRATGDPRSAQNLGFSGGSERLRCVGSACSLVTHVPQPFHFIPPELN
jgi:hypothetical protein